MKWVGYNSQMETTIDSLRSAAVLLVGFFARARASVLAIVVASATAVGLAACGGGGGGDASSSTAYFHGAERVAGLEYRYEEGGSGETDVRGGFPIEQGKTVVFSIGNTEIGMMTVRSDAQNEIVTPLHIGDKNRAIEIEQLLIALDTDTGPELIDLRKIQERDTNDLFGLQGLGENNGGRPILRSGRPIVISSAQVASDALKETNNCAYSGSFAGRLSDDSAAAIVLMPSIDELIVDGVVTVANASPAVSFTNESGTVKVGGTVLTIDLKIPPLTATIAGGLGTITLVSYNRIEFGGGTVFGTLRRVAGDPNADYRLAGVYDISGGDRAFVADIYGNGNGSAQISDIRDPNFQDLLLATSTGEFPTGSETAALTLQASTGSATLTLSATPNIFEGMGDDIGGTWCDL